MEAESKTLKKKGLISMKLWKRLYTVEEAEKAVIGVPFAGKVTAFKGAEKAPQALRKFFKNYWTYDLDRGEDLFDKPIIDLGDVKANSFKTLEKKLTKKINDVLEANPGISFVFIGGDHSITQITTKALGVKSYLCLDAHFDLVDSYAGDKHSHACTNKRISEFTEKVFLRGVRSSSREEHEEAASNKKIDWSKKIGFNGRIDYFSLDVDVLDPCYVGTGAPEALGFKPEQVINVIKSTEFKHFDLVEWIPPKGYAYAVQFLKEVLWK